MKVRFEAVVLAIVSSALAACTSDDTAAGADAATVDAVETDVSSDASDGSAPDASTTPESGDREASLDDGAAEVAPDATVASCAGDAGATGLSITNPTYAGDPRVKANEAVFSFINTVDDPSKQTLRVHNRGTTPVQISSVGVGPNPALFPAIYRQFNLPAAFRAVPARPLPTILEAGQDLDIAVQFLSTKTSPPDRMQNIGGQAVAASLVASTDQGCIQAGLFAVSLWNDSESVDPATMVPSGNYARYEPTFGQVLATLGYRVNVGPAWTALLNTNDMTVPPQPNTISDEVLVQRFVRANAGEPVGVLAVGRFSPRLDMPYGWYVAGAIGPAEAQPVDGGAGPAALHVVGTMSSVIGSDLNTSDHSEQVLPPLKAGSMTTFDPGTAVFSLWAFTNQRSYGNPTPDGGPAPAPANGDYMYTEDALNVDMAHQHRVRVYPLKDRAGALVPNSYLVGWEEASNGDYQDYVFILSNAKAPLSADAGPE